MSVKKPSSRLVGPEDLKRGQYVTIAFATQQLAPLPCDFGCDDEVEAVRMTIMPASAGWPFRVVEVCRPFVWVEDRDGDVFGLDLRRHRLARLSDRYGKAAFRKRKNEPRRRRGARR